MLRTTKNEKTALRMTKAQNAGLRTTKNEKTALRMTKAQNAGLRTTINCRSVGTTSKCKIEVLPLRGCYAIPAVVRDDRRLSS